MKILFKTLFLVPAFTLSSGSFAFPELPFCPAGGPPGWFNHFYDQRHLTQQPYNIRYAPPAYPPSRYSPPRYYTPKYQKNYYRAHDTQYAPTNHLNKYEPRYNTTHPYSNQPFTFNRNKKP